MKKEINGYNNEKKKQFKNYTSRFPFNNSIFFVINSRTYAFGSGSLSSDNVNGIWKFNSAKSVKLRIIRGVPWHIGDRFGMGEAQVTMEFDFDKYRFYDEKSGKLKDEGKFVIYNLNFARKSHIQRSKLEFHD